MPIDSARLAELLDSVSTVTVLTGAGVSTDSGVPDFKTIDDQWDFPVSRVEAISRNFFHKNPALFWQAYRYLFTLKSQVEPNSFHRAIAELERTHKVVVLTQNIDGLHQKAGSSHVLEMHGNLSKVICNRMSCKYEEALTPEHNENSRCPVCRKLLRPDAVLFGEVPRHYPEAEEVAFSAGLLIVAGTALEVAPVSNLPREREWRYPERESLWVNRFAPPYGYIFSRQYRGELRDFASLLSAYNESRASE